MSNKGVTKIRLLAATGLVTAALVSAPANAHQEHNYIAPLAAFITLNALFHHQHYRRHHYRHHGHHGHHQPHYRKHSHSHGGYGGPRHKRHRH